MQSLPPPSNRSMAGFRSNSLSDAVAAQARYRSSRRLAVVGVLSLLLVGVIVGVAVSAAKRESDDPVPAGSSSSIKLLCSGTLHPDECRSSLNQAAKGTSTSDPTKVFQLAVQITVTELEKALALYSSLASNKSLDNFTAAALGECSELVGLAVDSLYDTMAASDLTADTLENLKTSLSTVITDQSTCIDDMEAAAPAIKTAVMESLANSSIFASNALAIFNEISNLVSQFKQRKLLTATSPPLSQTFPVWVSKHDRKLLQSSDVTKEADIIVSQDGSGQYRTIKEALEAVPKKSSKRTVIYVKKGVYKENVNVDKTRWNIMMVGDGMATTVITGSLNFVDGTPTFKTATLSVFGKGFMARDIGIQNTAGAAKHQAVAMMSKSDHSVFYRCSFDAFQDTLYSHSNRQFFRECEITGTVDFIFGNAAVVYQACNILPRAPMPNQSDTITAQGRVDPNQNTGISIHTCNVEAANGNGVAGADVFLGRPWKPYAVTVVMKSTIAGIINPKGWMPWSGNTAPDTIFYGEYQNRGPGAGTENRVNWKGVTSTMTAEQAGKFTAAQFLGAESWLPQSGVPFAGGV